MALSVIEEFRKDALLDVAKRMALAAITAPKARGFNNLEVAVVCGAELEQLGRAAIAIGEEEDNPTFLRDGNNVLQSAEAALLVGTRIRSLGLKLCGLCGFSNCAQKNTAPDTPCVFNTSDLGTAVGSAVALAADCRVDTRIMYTMGIAARKLGYLSPDIKIIYGVPLSATAKNPYFDRKP
ncbi:MAG TPA: ferredoxin [Bacteroidales bacterium]|nr:ferredoxin [Bacteroidales bacterium]